MINDLAEIFALDPMSLTKDDERLRAMIDYYREKRAQYMAGDKKAGKKVEKKEPGPAISLDDLDLGI